MDVGAWIEAAGWWSYLVVFAVTAGETSAFVGLVLPGETVVLLASAVAGQGDLNPLVIALLVVAGGMAGDNLGFALGRRWERRPSARGRYRLGDDHRIVGARGFLARHGGAAVFTGRFIGFVRTFLPLVAGASGMAYRRFFLYSTAASLVWGVGNVLLGYFAGAAALGLLHSAGLIGAVALAVTTVAALVVLGVLRRRRAQEPTHMFTSVSSVQKG